MGKGEEGEVYGITSIALIYLLEDDALKLVLACWWTIKTRLQPSN